MSLGLSLNSTKKTSPNHYCTTEHEGLNDCKTKLFIPRFDLDKEGVFKKAHTSQERSDDSSKNKTKTNYERMAKGQKGKFRFYLCTGIFSSFGCVHSIHFAARKLLQCSVHKQCLNDTVASRDSVFLQQKQKSNVKNFPFEKSQMQFEIHHFSRILCSSSCSQPQQASRD